MGNLISYDEFTQKIQKYKLSTTLITCAKLNWKIWKLDPSSLRITDPYHHIFLSRAYASRIGVLSFLSNEDVDKVAEEKDIINLSHQYLEVKDAHIDQSWFESNEVAVIKKDLSTSQALKPLIQNVPDLEELSRLIAADLFPIRSVGSQWMHAIIDLNFSYRNWLIQKYLDEATNGNYFKGLSKYLSFHPIDFYRGAFFILTIAENIKDSSGLFFIRDNHVDENLKSKYGVSSDLLRLIAERFSCNTSIFRKWHEEEVLMLPEFYQKYAPLPLGAQPLIWIGDEVTGGDKSAIHSYLLLSPWYYILAYSRYLFDRIQDAFGDPESGSIQGKIGEAVNKYFSYFLDYYSIPYVCFDNIILPGNRDKSIPDFFIPLGDKRGLLIEFKKSFGSKEFKTIFPASSLVESYERTYEAFDQFLHIAKNPSKLSQYSKNEINEFVCIICCLEPLTTEATSFLKFAENIRLLEQTGIQGLEVMSLHELEKWIEEIGCKEIFNISKDRWMKGKGSHFFHLSVTAENKQTARFDHLEETFKELFPTLQRSSNSIREC
ncbi:MAG: hypothetical protein IPJ69_08150 [Deltaproteobacteria bacterium]|nr:MAG: hypothetical protein IPJ69_08150 [Deltaproteobacteria bacterium]